VTVAELEISWSEIETPPKGSSLAGRRPSGAGTTVGVLIAVDHEGGRHLLLEAAPDVRVPSTRAVKGLTVEIAELQVGDRPVRSYLDVACTDSSMNRNFANVAAEIIGGLSEAGVVPGDLLERTFRRWRWFWGSLGGEMSDTAAIGLFAELWFLEHWIGLGDASIATWTGPSGDRHDFKSTLVSVEVKGTRVRSDGSATHRISNLDQLDDPDAGTLYLFSLRVIPDPIGGHSLRKSVDRLRAALIDKPDDLHALEERLAAVGYGPAAAEGNDSPLRVTAEELFEVSEGFPRLTPDNFPDGPPAGVDDITYTLDLAACQPWRVAAKSSDSAAENIRGKLLDSSG
jgi:hypothetical protein